MAGPPARLDENPEPAKAEAPPKVAASRIVHVTVYPDSALVTREVEVPAGAGAVELVVTPLPERTVNSSLYSENSDGIRVLTTRFRTRPVKENTREEVRKLEDEIKKLQANTRKIQADTEACKQNMGLLGKLENFTTVSTQHATEKGKLDSEATIALAKYLMEGRGEKTKEMVALQQQMETNAEQLEFAQRKPARDVGRHQQDGARRRHRGGQGECRRRKGAPQLSGGRGLVASAVQDAAPARTSRTISRSNTSPPSYSRPARSGRTSTWCCPRPSPCSTPPPRT